MSHSAAQQEIVARMQRPQRHRLLQGFPPLPLMQAASKSQSGFAVRQADGAVVDISQRVLLHGEKPEPGDLIKPFINIDKSRPLIIGIIPHTQCIPRTHACGFCTFPHDAPNKSERAIVVDSVAGEIDDVVDWHEDKLVGRRVDAIYFGGGTANLSSTAQIKELFGKLSEKFNVAQAEVTLEGIPSLFAAWFHSHLRALAALPVRHKRISMGIQTFDWQQLGRMGRHAFGDESMVKGIIRRAHSLDFTASGDFLFALPGQTFDQMREDVDRAIDCGFDQICLYHLVLYAGLGTPWSKNEGLVAQMKEPEAVAGYWLDLRARLLERGFVQTTLTNFERKEIHGTERRFIYEEASFNPDVYDVLGFGPLSISAHMDYAQGRGVKLLRRKSLGALPWSGDDLYFGYEQEDLKLLWITRCLAGLSLNRARYRSRFSGDVVEHFPAAFAAAVEQGLLAVGDESITLTPRGMFYSDSVVGTFAAERATKLREHALGLNTLGVLEKPIDFHSELYSGMG
jgi:coproporphyrinogen III oxidase-like Fe-S oxidoreductase